MKQGVSCKEAILKVRKSLKLPRKSCKNSNPEGNNEMREKERSNYQEKEERKNRERVRGRHERKKKTEEAGAQRATNEVNE